MGIVELPVDLFVAMLGWKKTVQSIISSIIPVAILLPVDNRRYFTICAILDNRLVLTINRTKLLDYRKNDFHLLCSSLPLLFITISVSHSVFNVFHGGICLFKSTKQIIKPAKQHTLSFVKLHYHLLLKIAIKHENQVTTIYI